MTYSVGVSSPLLILTLLHVLILLGSGQDALHHLPTITPSSTSASATPQGMLMEDKVRLGSTPPGCHDRCSSCSPCTAVQVPTLPGHEKLHPRPGSTVTAPTAAAAAAAGKYPNYKPLGWKCRCGDRLFNP